jgi:hypothetical protein
MMEEFVFKINESSSPALVLVSAWIRARARGKIYYVLN